MNPIQLIRLQSGSDLISECVELSPELFKLNTPVSVEFIERAGRPVLFMNPWLPGSLMVDESVVLNRRDILFIAEVQPILVQNYLEMVGKINQVKVAFKEGVQKEEGMEEDLHLLEGMDMEGHTLQ